MSTFSVPTWAWALFAGVVIGALAIDLVMHRGDHAGSRRAALCWSGIWIGVSLLFAGFIAIELGGHPAQAFVNAWLVEKSLSIDNLFVFLVIFRRLRVPHSEQHRVLFWGILGAFVTRALFIGTGSVILTHSQAATWLFGGFLLYTGQKALRTNPEEENDQENKVLSWLESRLPFTPKRHGHAFLVAQAGRRVATPLLLALVAIELSDIMFAVDSIPAVFAITKESFIVFTSNVFAILGLRALYLVLAEVVADLKYLHYGLGGLLLFVGAKMLASSFVHIPHVASLAITVAILAAAIIPSVVVRRRAAQH